ncbi:hypothetical protein AB0E96_00510 [Kitasatospora sp. NPDC036755]|uniref:hypothetical protein n=1 Tax=Kitasatospora sp. NPDC036755 TaxID=3154600 RepID=UPI00340FD13F
MLLRTLIAAALIAPAPAAVQQPTGWRVAIHVHGPTMSITRIMPEPLCASTSNHLTEALLEAGYESYGVLAQSGTDAANRVRRLYDTHTEPAPGEYPPAATC